MFALKHIVIEDFTPKIDVRPVKIGSLKSAQFVIELKDTFSFALRHYTPILVSGTEFTPVLAALYNSSSVFIMA